MVTQCVLLDGTLSGQYLPDLKRTSGDLDSLLRILTPCHIRKPTAQFQAVRKEEI